MSNQSHCLLHLGVQSLSDVSHQAIVQGVEETPDKGGGYVSCMPPLLPTR
jgi:hypothetical protein